MSAQSVSQATVPVSDVPDRSALGTVKRYPARPHGPGEAISTSAFRVPEYIVQSAWHEHGPFLYWLVDALRPRCFVELGCHNGFSYFVACQAIKQLGLGTTCYAVDTWQGDEHSGFYGEEIFAAVSAHNDAHYSAFSQLLRSTFDDALQYFPDGMVDLLHVDGRHLYGDVSSDFASWRPKLAEDAVVLFHDTNVREREFGVWKFFHELRAQHPSFEFKHGHGLGVVALGRVPPALAPLFDADDPTVDDVRAMYAALGDGVTHRWSLSLTRAELKRATQAHQSEAATLRAELAQSVAAAQAATQGLQAQLHALEEARRSEGDALRAEMARRGEAAQAELARQGATARAAEAQLRGELARQSEVAREAEARLRANLEEMTGRVRAGEALRERLEGRLAEAGALRADLAARATELREAQRGAELLRETLDLTTRELAAARDAAGRAAGAQQALDARVSQLQAEKGQLGDQVELARREADRIRADHLRLTNSLSWRLTARARRFAARRPRLARRLLTAARAGWWIATFRYGRFATVLRRRRMIREDERFLAESGLFDRDFYVGANPDVLGSRMSPARHYLLFGGFEGRRPHALFDGAWYLETYPDVGACGMNPLLHFLRHGLAEGRRPNRHFDPAWYREQSPEAAAAGTNPVVHYLARGAAQGLDPAPSFRTRWYQDAYPDVVQSGMNPLAHFLLHGEAEGRRGTDMSSRDLDVIRAAVAVGSSPNLDGDNDVALRQVTLIAASDLFDRAWYLDKNPDVAAAGIDPVLHYLAHGAQERRDPGPNFSTKYYFDAYRSVEQAGMNPLVHYLEHGQAEGLSIAPPLREPTAASIVEDRLFGLQPMPVFAVPYAPRRIVMVTDSINAGHLYGGVGTALILSALIANRLDTTLCVVTRIEQAEQENVGRILRLQGIPMPRDIEFVFARPGTGSQIPTGDEDLFVTTSWWTTHSALRSLPPERIVYLLQEDERMFYPFGDDHLLCSEILRNSRLRFVVNSKLLYDHLAQDGAASVAQRGIAFEPAFPESVYHMEEGGPPKEKASFLFYARPNNLRNLYYRGLQVLHAAVARGILDPKAWDFHFVGKDLGPIALPSDIRPKLLQNLAWSDYAALIRRTDLGLSLMYTPHPSYPPLDLAASGAVAVTNRFGNKTTLDRYSRNIICADSDIESLVQGLARGAELALDDRRRRANYAAQGIGRDWTAALRPVIDRILEG